ncbi:MAG: endonuclease/exonuclease/phosphatase family protein [Candidatus Eremiobacteraeota bacterium]|nr:endonuclease/exonuclease/phosphatase family protein [Candidatus Eremiobacteraeota bacterium]
MRRRIARPLAQPVVVASYNLHGTQDNDSSRFPAIARELAAHRVDICGFQEVVKSETIEDTSYQVARYLSHLTGTRYHTYWAFCHPFYDRYPEGISILSRFPITSPSVIDLDVTLRRGAKPLMPRKALAASIAVRGKRIIFVTLHLDHHRMAAVRTAQLTLLLRKLSSLYGIRGIQGTVVTGDFNASEWSSPLNLMKRRSFRDTYRLINGWGGNTFPSCSPSCRIDFILLKGRMKILNSYLILKDSWMSDHAGVLSIIR